MQAIHSICRLCLCQDEASLRPVARTLDTSLTIEDVERFTGIKIKLKGTEQYAFCFGCVRKLKVSAEFRKACLNNDTRFRELLDVLTASVVDGVSTEAGEKRNPLDAGSVPVDDEDDTDDDYEYEYNYEEEDGRAIDPAELEYSQDGYACTIDDSDSEDVSFIEPPNYSANYIEPCSETARFDSDEYETDEFFKPKNVPKKKWRSSQLPVDVEKEEEQQQKSPEPREINTKRTRNSFRPQLLCAICGKLITNISTHISSVHTSERTHACPHCPAVMTQKGNLVKHIRAVHLKKVCKTCKICGKGYTHMNSLITHMLSKHGIGNRHKCTMCPKQFNAKSALSDHMKRKHSNARPLSCAICGMQFKVRREFVIHKRVHSDEQPYACGKCPKRFKSSNARKVHELTHTGIQFECELCHRSYRYKALLNMHMRKTHPDRPQGEEENRSEEQE